MITSHPLLSNDPLLKISLSMNLHRIRRKSIDRLDDHRFRCPPFIREQNTTVMINITPKRESNLDRPSGG